MQKRWTLVPVLMALMVIGGISACTKTTEVGMKPVLELKDAPGFLYKDTTLSRGVTYHFLVEASRSEDASLLSSFDISRKYDDNVDNRDTSVYYEELKGDRRTSFDLDFRFDTRNKPGKERFIFTVKNMYGVVNQKVIVVTVK